MPVDRQQKTLPLRVVRQVDETLPDSELARIPDFHAAIKKCVDNSGHDDKFIALDLEIDTAQWSRIKTGQANFPPKRINDLMDICANEIPLRWLAFSRGYGLVRLKSSLEIDLEAERQKNAELELKLKHFEEFIGKMK